MLGCKCHSGLGNQTEMIHVMHFCICVLCFYFQNIKISHKFRSPDTHDTLLDRRNGLSLDAMHSVLRARGHIIQTIIKKLHHGELAQIQPCQLAIASYRLHPISWNYHDVTLGDRRRSPTDSATLSNIWQHLGSTTYQMRESLSDWLPRVAESCRPESPV